MKIVYVSVFLILFLGFCASDSPHSVNGKIIEKQDGLTIVKVWGTHQERGYAYGFLLGDAILSIHAKYTISLFGELYPDAKVLLKNKSHFSIPEQYLEEAKSIVRGMKANNSSLTDFDEWDLLLSNAFLDVLGFRYELSQGKYGCSSLISWGDATKGTELNGGSVISRHVDWGAEDVLTKNNVVVVHVPSEEDEQPWAMVGFAGQIGVLSGMNQQGLGAFQHVVFSSSSSPVYDQHYEPIWLTLRKAVEKKDFNKDGSNDVNDVKSAIEANKNGYADSYIVSAIANTQEDSKVALIAEIDPAIPYFTFRGNEYSDSIPGDNLYTANNEIKRKGKNKICSRYDEVTEALGTGVNVSTQKNWEIVKTYSNSEELGFDNLQFMQFVPKDLSLRLSVYINHRQAYLNEPVEIELGPLFEK